MVGYYTHLHTIVRAITDVPPWARSDDGVAALLSSKIAVDLPAMFTWWLFTTLTTLTTLTLLTTHLYLCCNLVECFLEWIRHASTDWNIHKKHRSRANPIVTEVITTQAQPLTLCVHTQAYKYISSNKTHVFVIGGRWFCFLIWLLLRPEINDRKRLAWSHLLRPFIFIESAQVNIQSDHSLH